jgi:hypothetical protein
VNPLYLGDDHAETASAADTTFTNPSTTTLLCLTVCVDHTKAAPYASGDLKTGASVTTTGNNNVVIQSGGYYDGITFSGGSGSNTAKVILHNNSTAANQIYQNCTFTTASTTAAARFQMGFAVTQMGCVRFVNTTVQFGNKRDARTQLQCAL